MRALVYHGPKNSHESNLDQAAEGYQNFDDRKDGWTKVLVHPVDEWTR